MFPLRLVIVLLSLLFSNFNSAKCYEDRERTNINPNSSLCTASDHGRLLCDEECKNILLCLGDKRDVLVETCKEDKYCFQPGIDFVDLPKEVLCSSTLNSCNNTVYPIPCNSIGQLPDPNDCHWYHICLVEGNSSIPKKCKDNYGFSAKTSQCSEHLVNNECVGRPLLPCGKVGFVGVSKDRPALWFYCKKDQRGLFVHDINICEFENPFDLDNLYCPEWLENGEMKI